MTTSLIAALYVVEGGVYYGVDGVDPWDEVRDARTYAGPWPVVAHPPCERWGRYARGGPSAKVPREVGADAGCFEAALSAVRRWGGVLEHPADSLAWDRFNLPAPPRAGGWVRGLCGGWCCHVEQGHYGHAARKGTWLYAVGCELMPLRWGRSAALARLDDGFHSADERARARRRGVVERLSRLSTPVLFRDVLLELARSVRMVVRSAA